MSIRTKLLSYKGLKMFLIDRLAVGIQGYPCQQKYKNSFIYSVQNKKLTGEAEQFTLEWKLVSDCTAYETASLCK